MPTPLPQPPATSPEHNAARACPDELWELGARAVERARRWVEESADEPAPRSAELLSRILADPDGLEFTTRFVDDVVRPAALAVAAPHPHLIRRDHTHGTGSSHHLRRFGRPLVPHRGRGRRHPARVEDDRVPHGPLR